MQTALPLSSSLTNAEKAKLWAADDGPPASEKMADLTRTLEEQFAESARLEAAIRANLRGVGYGD